MTACHYLARETFLDYIDFEKNAAIRVRFRRVGSENPLKWIVSGEMGRHNYFQNSENQSKTVELVLFTRKP